ncbi:c-type cytochrome [Tropicimonas isoalkanivorans]|uniref:Cytochrome c n=1 Tax=Tropicimonas isoalkanivorans TaxID=441112 RepID=A0A1I1DC70_9RHOB|nr:cytochrome c [Tropicimonas isoalkanivorans]
MLRYVLTFLAAALAGDLSAQEFETLKGHGGPIMGIAVSPDGEVASASFDNSVGLWAGGTPVWLEGHEAAVTAIAFGPNGELVTGGDDFAVRLWGRAPRLLGQHQGKVAGVAVSPNGDLVASGSWDGTIRLWPLDGSAAQTLPPPGAGVNDVAFDPGGEHLYASTSAGLVLRYDLAGGTPAPLARHGFGVNCLIVGEGWVAYGAVDGGTRVIDAESGAQIADFTLDRRPVLAMAYNAQTGRIAVGDGHGYIMVLDTAEWRIVQDFRATRQGPVWALAFSPDGSVLHAGGLEDVVYSWPVGLLDSFDPEMGNDRTFLRNADSMPNGERQFVRKCSICHALSPGPSRKAGPTLHGLFGRAAGTVPDYSYSDTLTGSDIVWTAETVDRLFDQGPDHYIPGSKMPMQVIAGAGDREDLIKYLETATKGD